jgi:predicted amidohydrolase YtcJ
MIIANTKAIQAAGISSKTIDPEGGKIDREKDGYPSGPFREAAAQIIFAAMPMPDMQRITATTKECFKKLAGKGITSAGVILQTDEEGILGKQGAYDILLMNALID